MRHAGVGFPNGAVDNAKVFALPSPDLLMLSTEGRYHHDDAVRAGKRVLWRAIPRIGKRPAELGWSPSRFVAETINLTDAPSLPITDFVFANELDLQDERGDKQDDYANLSQRYALIGQWALGVVQGLRVWSPGTRIHWPAWTPDHFAFGDFAPLWMPAAEACDVIDFHAYDSLNAVEQAYYTMRRLFPHKPIALTEWHCKGDVQAERGVLQWLADTMVADPFFEAAYFFIWRWWHHPGWWDGAWDIEHSTARRQLFQHPPLAAIPEPVEPEPIPEPIPPVEPTIPTPSPWEHFTAEAIAAAAECPLENVRSNWPRLVEQLAHCGINERLVQIGMIGTVAKESASSFAPVREAFYLGEPEPASTHRAGLAYAPFWGRGYIQLTHAGNYRTYGQRVAALWKADPNHPDFDLVANPDNALNPDISAAVSALYFRDTKTVQGYSLVDACRAQDWDWVRRLVYGGPDPDGAARIGRIAAALTGAVPMPTSKVSYDPNYPATLQDDEWSCAPSSLDWALRSLGRRPGPTYIETLLVRDGIVSHDLGLLIGTGGPLAEWIGRTGADYYGGDGFYGNAESIVTFDGAALEGDHAYPILIGGHNWGGPNRGHWTAVRGYDAGRDVLLLANPAGSSPTYGGQEMTRAQFAARAPFSMVRMLHPDLFEVAPAPPAPDPVPAPNPVPQPSRAHVLVSEISERLEELRRIVA